MTGLIVAVVLGAAVLGGAFANKYLRIPAPWAWIVLGAALSFVPGLHDVTLPPDVMLFLFLPALLYWETINISLQQMRRSMRVILLQSFGLVFATAAVIAVIGHWAGLALPVAILLGAILSPTDATAVATMAPRLPRRMSTVLRGESLINDASALALYAVAIAAIGAGRDVVPLDISIRFVWAVVGGVGSGLLVAYGIFWLRRVARRPAIDDTISLLSPFLLYLPAELLGASGVVAVVAGALLLSRLVTPYISAEARNEGFNFWKVSTYVINGSLFVLIGLQARSVVGTIAADPTGGVLMLGLLCSVTLLVVRFVWIQVVTVLIRAIDRRPSQRARRAPFRYRLVSSWGGFRGAVSLAAALAVPTAAAGLPPGQRGTVIAVTFIVIVFTIFVQGAIIPFVVRRARLQDDPDELTERRLAASEPIQDALRHLDEDAEELGVSDSVRDKVRSMLEHHLDTARVTGDEPQPDEVRPETQKEELMLAVLTRKRAAVIRLRNQGRIDDGVLMRVQSRLDIEELRLTAERES